MNEIPQEKELRIVLDGPAATALKTMVESMKAELSAVKVLPSQFVSFLVIDFMETYFEKDKTILIAEFFDSDTYYEVMRKKAKASPNYEELMEMALDQARKIKGKRRRKSNSKQDIALKSKEPSGHEKI